MAITLDKKKRIVKTLAEEFGRSAAVLFTDFRGVDVDGITRLRHEMRGGNLKYIVSKRNLITRALGEKDIAVPDEFLEGSTGLVFSEDEPITAAKIIEQFRKEYPSFLVKGGVMGAHTLSVSDVEKLAATPTRDELLAGLARALNAPLMKLANAGAGIILNLAYALQAVGSEKGRPREGS